MTLPHVRGVTLVAVLAIALSAGTAFGAPVFFIRGPSSPFAGTRFDGELYAATKRVYFLGFRTTAGATDGSVWYYDIAAKSYSNTGVTMPVPVSNYGIAALTDPTGLGFYIFGGRDANGNIVTTVQAYYPATNTTAVITGDPWPGTTPSRCVSLPAMGVATVGNTAVVMGGSSFLANGCVDDNSAETWMFDPMAAAGARWSKGPSLNLARGYITPAVMGNTVYAIGGDINVAGTPTPQKTVEASVSGGPWNDAGVSDLPETCDESQAFAFTAGQLSNDIILAGCGQWPNAVPDVLLYDTVGNTWSIVGALNDNRRNHAGSWLGPSGKSGMFILGGYGAPSFLDPIQTSEIGPATVRPGARQASRPSSGPRGPVATT